MLLIKKEKDIMNWNISLNNCASNTNHHMIGKNITFHGNTKYIYRYKDTVVIGHGRIYNEQDLWINVLNMNNAPLVKIHPLVIVIELYNKFGFEKTIEYLDGDYSFVLFDINLYGDESIIYVAKDPFGLCPLYQWISTSTTNSKKVQFQDDNIEQQKQYVFSSSNEATENMMIESIPNGHYHIFTHSFKVSANWKLKKKCKYYALPFYSTYVDEDTPEYKNDIVTQIEIAINKRIKYILNYENAFYIAQLQNNILSTETQQYMNTLVNEYNTISNCSKIKIGTIYFEEQYSNNIFQYLQKNETKYNTKIECVQIIIGVDTNILELEEQYPNIIHNLKINLNTTDPSIIRASFIPWMIAKHIHEVEPDIKYVFMGEPFVQKWITTNVFDRRDALNNTWFLENLKGWVSAFFEYYIELIIPFLDRVLIQKI